jgi:hypothetical protein
MPEKLKKKKKISDEFFSKFYFLKVHSKKLKIIKLK